MNINKIFFYIRILSTIGILLALFLLWEQIFRPACLENLRFPDASNRINWLYRYFLRFNLSKIKITTMDGEFRIGILSKHRVYRISSTTCTMPGMYRLPTCYDQRFHIGGGD